MERLFFECAVRAALLAGATALALYGMRVKSAAAKYSIWTGVLASMLLLPIWTIWGPKLSLPVLPPFAHGVPNETIARIDLFSAGASASPRVSFQQAIFLSAYLLGFCLLFLRVIVGTVRARVLVSNAIFHDGVLVSALCATPMTVGLIHPIVIFPKQWVDWPKSQLDAIVTHETEHASRRHSLVQWLALLNRALFWFHPVAWWLERHLSALAEETCDNAVLAAGHDPRKYSEYLLDMARTVNRSGGRLNIAGMAMPGSSLPRRIHQILEVGLTPHISRARLLCVRVTCAIACTVIAAGTLSHAHANSSVTQDSTHSATGSATNSATKFVLGDLKIEGDSHDRDGVKDRILKALNGQEFDDSKALADEAAGGIRADFQERGYFKVVVHDPGVQLVGEAINGKQSVLITASVVEGDQFRLRNLTIQSSVPNQTLSIPAATLRDQFHIRSGDLFNMTEIRAGLERLQRLYFDRGYADVSAEPDTEIDSVSHSIDLILRVTEGPHKQ